MVLISLVPMLNLLYFYISTFQSMCAVLNMAVFCSSLTSCFPVMMLTYFLNDFEIVPVAPIITFITFVFTFHMCCISIVSYLCFRIFSASFLITFLSPEITTSINIHVPLSLSWIIMSGLLLGILLSVCTCWFHNMVILPPWLVSTDFGTCSYQCFLSNCTPVSLHMLKCSCAHTVVIIIIIIIIIIIKLQRVFWRLCFPVCLNFTWALNTKPICPIQFFYGVSNGMIKNWIHELLGIPTHWAKDHT